MLKNFFILTLKSIRYRPLRSWLTALGIIIGVMLIVIIFSLGGGIQHAVGKMLQMFGSDLIVVYPGEETNPFAGIVGGQKFRTEDILALQNIPGVRFVMPMNIRTFNVEFRGTKKSVLTHVAFIEGMKTIFEESQGFRMEDGRWPATEEERSVVLGYLVAYDLFGETIRVGDEIIVQSKRFSVSGVLMRLGTQDDDNSVFLSRVNAEAMTGERLDPMAVMVKIETGSDISIVAQRIRAQLSQQQAVQDFSVLTPEQAGRLVGDVLKAIELSLMFLAFVSLIVGAVGIMNTMYTSVLERTKQVGIMKAVGASSEAILSLFLIESGMIGLVGGFIGMFLGIGIAWIIGSMAPKFGVEKLFSFASIDFLGLLVILLITFMTGVIAGVLPARRAASMEPAEALRYE